MRVINNLVLHLAGAWGTWRKKDGATSRSVTHPVTRPTQLHVTRGVAGEFTGTRSRKLVPCALRHQSRSTVRDSDDDTNAATKCRRPVVEGRRDEPEG